MSVKGWLASLAGAVVLVSLVGSAGAFDPEATFKKGALVLSAEGGGGSQHNIENQQFQTGLEFWNTGIRIGVLPFGTSLSGPLHGALEVGLEPFYQRYTRPLDAFFGGLGASVRYHFLSLGRVVPYVEVFAAPGGTDLRTREIASTFTFLLFGGVGASVFVTDRAAIYAGYRLQHVSNGNTERPNRGFESHTGVAGVSIFFP
jgi:hypothetical protein